VLLFVKEYKPPGYDRPIQLIGYFEDLDELAREAHRVSGHATGVFFNLNPLHPETISREVNRLRKSRRGFSAKNADVVRRELLLIDVDPIRPGLSSATDAEKKSSFRKTTQILKFLTDEGWPAPAVVDSGNGHHLIYRIDIPADDDGLVKHVLKALSNRFNADGVEIDTGVFDPARLCKVPGTKSCKGNDTVDRPHRFSRLIHANETLEVVTRDRLEELVDALGNPVDQSEVSPPTPEWTLRDASAYVEKMPKAVSGQHGHNDLFAVACRLIIGFDIPVDNALPILREYSKRCKPGWQEHELLRKLKEADKLLGERGSLILRRACADDVRHRRSSGEKGVFSGWVPDFAFCDAEEFLVPLTAYERLNRIQPAFSLAVWQQQRSDAVVPDVFLRQCFWGADHTKNWRRELITWVGFQPVESENEFFACPGNCPLHGSAIRHQHFQLDPDKDHGLLEFFKGEPQLEEVGEEDDPEWAKEESTDSMKSNDWANDSEDKSYLDDLDAAEKAMDQMFVEAAIVENENSRIGHRTFHVFDDDEKYAKLRKQAKKVGRLLNVYWPVLLFGDSPRVDLSASQQRLFLGIVRELTYSSRSRRFDKAIIVEDGRVPVGRGGMAICPFLDARLRYVVFGGNGRRQYKGKGYRLLGKGWMIRAGYENEKDESDPWKPIIQMFADLCSLSERFQLTVVGRHSGRKKWMDLDEMRGMLSTGYGRELLESCVIRIFAPDDYYLVWRTWFSKRLGFSWIPENADDGTGTDASGNAKRSGIRNAEDIKEYIRREGLTQGDLAERLDCSRERVSRNLSGRSNSQRFIEEVNQLCDED